MGTGKKDTASIAESSPASIGLTDDTDPERQRSAERYVHPFEVMPPQSQDTAFLNPILTPCDTPHHQRP
jgi:hypothetical protein